MSTLSDDRPMSHPDLARRQTPEERELEKKTAELAALKAQLAQRELDLATLQNELHAFEARYFRTVGALYAELDDLEAQIAEAEARRHADDQNLRQQAAGARAKATASAHAVSAFRAGDDQGTDFTPREDLKKLYREIARLIHPDLATDDDARARRNRLMAEANKAYAEGHEAKLRAILDEWQSSPESVEGQGVAAELVRTIRKIHQVERRLADIDAETLELKRSELHTLWRRVETEAAQHRNLLAKMAEQLKQRIAAVRTQLTNLSSAGTAV